MRVAPTIQKLASFPPPRARGEGRRRAFRGAEILYKTTDQLVSRKETHFRRSQLHSARFMVFGRLDEVSARRKMLVYAVLFYSVSTQLRNCQRSLQLAPHLFLFSIWVLFFSLLTIQLFPPKWVSPSCSASTFWHHVNLFLLARCALVKVWKIHGVPLFSFWVILLCILLLHHVILY